MKKLMIATAAGVVAAGAFAEAEVWNLTFNAKCLVPSYTKAGEVDYYKQGSVKYTAMQVNADTYAWDSKNFYGDANLNGTTGTFGKKDEKVWADVGFGVDGNWFNCAGFGTEKSVSGSFTGNMADGTPAYGTWSVKVNASAAKKLDANPDLTLTDLVKLPKAVLESKKDWEALQDAIESQVKGATTLAELAEIADAKLAAAESAYIESTNKLAEVDSKIKGLNEDLDSYNKKYRSMIGLIKAADTEYTLDTGKVDEAYTAYTNQQTKAENYYKTNIKPLKDIVEKYNTHEGLAETFDGDVFARDEAVKATNEVIAVYEKHYKGYQDGVASYEDAWKAEAAVTNSFNTYMNELAGFAVDTNDVNKTAAKHKEAAQKGYEAEVKVMNDEIAAYNAVNTVKKLAPHEMWGNYEFFESFGERKAADVAVNGFIGKKDDDTLVYEYDIEYFNKNNGWALYKVTGTKDVLKNSKDFVEDVKGAQETLKNATADKEQLEKILVDSLKKEFLKD